MRLTGWHALAPPLWRDCAARVPRGGSQAPLAALHAAEGPQGPDPVPGGRYAPFTNARAPSSYLAGAARPWCTDRRRGRGASRKVRAARSSRRGASWRPSQSPDCRPRREACSPEPLGRQSNVRMRRASAGERLEWSGGPALDRGRVHQRRGGLVIMGRARDAGSPVTRQRIRQSTGRPGAGRGRTRCAVRSGCAVRQGRMRAVPVGAG